MSEDQGSATDSVTCEWFCNNIPVFGTFIWEKVLEAAKELGFTEFKAYDGWLDKCVWCSDQRMRTLTMGYYLGGKISTIVTRLASF